MQARMPPLDRSGIPSAFRCVRSRLTNTSSIDVEVDMGTSSDETVVEDFTCR